MRLPFRHPFRRAPEPTPREIGIRRARRVIAYARCLRSPRDRITMLNYAAFLRRNVPPLPVHDSGEFLFY